MNPPRMVDKKFETSPYPFSSVSFQNQQEIPANTATPLLDPTKSFNLRGTQMVRLCNLYFSEICDLVSSKVNAFFGCDK